MPRADAAAERAWKKALDEHATHVLHGVLTHGVELIANTRQSPLIGGAPTLEVAGPDGVWRRYFVRLTEASPYLPVEI